MRRREFLALVGAGLMGCEMPFRPSMVVVGGFTGAGRIIDPIGDSRTVGQASVVPADPGDGYRYFLRTALPAIVTVGTETDPRGFKHDGISGIVTADLVTRCQDSGGRVPTPNRVIFWGGINDVRTPIVADTTRANLRACMDALLDDASAPSVILVGEAYLIAPGRLTIPMGTAMRGLRAFQRNALAEYAASGGRGARFYMLDPLWELADIKDDGVHVLDVGFERLSDALVPVIASFPGAQPTPKATQQATLIAARGAHLKHGFDMRDEPTIVAGKVSQYTAFVGGRTLDQALALSRGYWTGADLELLAGQEDFEFDFMLGSGATWHSGAGTVAAAFQLYAAPSTAFPITTMQVWSGSDGGNHFAAMRFTDTDALFNLGDDTGYAQVQAPLAWDTLPHVITWEFDGVDITSAGSFRCFIDGVEAVVTLTVPFTPGAVAGVADAVGGYPVVPPPACYFAWQGTIGAVLVDDQAGAGPRAALTAFVEAVAERDKWA